MKPINLILLLFILFCASSNIFSQVSPALKNVKCSQIVEGVKLCTASQTFTYQLGEQVILRLYLENITPQEKLLKSSNEFSFRLRPPYEDKVTDDNGNKVPTIIDILNQKATSKTITKEESDELFLRCCVNVCSRCGNSLTLAPFQKMDFDYDLNYNYHFESRGIYYVEIHRNLVKQTTTPIKAETLLKILLERIKIEIK